MGHPCNNNFYDLDPQERSDRMTEAADRAGVNDFFDLDPEDRAAVYDNDED